MAKREKRIQELVNICKAKGVSKEVCEGVADYFSNATPFPLPKRDDTEKMVKVLDVFLSIECAKRDRIPTNEVYAFLRSNPLIKLNNKKITYALDQLGYERKLLYDAAKGNVTRYVVKSDELKAREAIELAQL